MLSAFLMVAGRQKESSLLSCLVKVVSAQKILQREVEIAPLLKATKFSKREGHNTRMKRAQTGCWEHSE